MGDLMLYAVLRMPYDMTMSSELSRRQFYSRVQEAADRLEKAEAALAEKATPVQVTTINHRKGDACRHGLFACLVCMNGRAAAEIGKSGSAASGQGGGV